MAERPATTEPSTEPPVPERARCGNCQAELRGPYCHRCGQPTRHVLKHLPALVHDGLDLFFDIDGRIMRTLPALYLKPGFLANEYFAGRRMRYIPPFRLMFFLSVLAFLVLQFSLSLPGNRLNVEVQAPTVRGDTPAQVRENYRKAVQDIRRERAQADLPAVVQAALERSEQGLRQQTNARLRQLGAPPLDAPAPAPAPAESAGTAPAASLPVAGSGQVATPAQAASVLSLGMPKTVHFAWLPAFLNQRINQGLQRARANVAAIYRGSSEDRNDIFRRIRSQALGVLPQALFVMLPLFAVLLKIAYLFKRRLYIEHLMVAMLSHAFIYLSLLLWGLLALLRDVSPAWFASALGWLNAALVVWMPVYLLLMQKRVYAQGWPMTLLKYAVLGLGYSVLVSCAVAGAVLVGFAS